MEFLSNQGLDETLAKLLEELGRNLEAAEVHARNGAVLKAVEILFTSRNVGHTRRMIEYLLAGLRQGFTFGITPSSISSTVSGLLEFGEQLDHGTMTKQEVDEASHSNSFNH